MNYPRNAWYVASWSNQLPESQLAGLTILDEPIVLWRTGGKVHALADRCVHRLAPLSLGRCEGSHLRCMYHGFLYDSSGQVVAIPGQDKIPPRARVRSYPAVDIHGWIWVWMGDPEKADESLIPATYSIDDPQWLQGQGTIDYNAEAQLIHDNLLDFSHLSFVHANSFGTPDDFSESLPKVTALPQGMRFERWLVNTPSPFSHPEQLVDFYQQYDFLVPGILVMWFGGFTAGSAQANNFGRPDFSRATSDVGCTSQAVTPMGPRQSRYFFSTGPHRSHGDEALKDAMMATTQQAFEEDRTMITAQQAIIDRTPSPTVIPSAHDRGITMFHNMVARLIKEESGGRAQH
ncbi:MAG: aromatic ring-hydroxylating dioxygenase subunit alpha [Proteobacteria bacterium]|nr:aromatic ring-hydroxylating dioxygenase subunit alpha [Pseudomonadota bacterium]